MERLVPWISVLVVTLTICALVLTTVAVVVVFRWQRRVQREHDESWAPPERMLAHMASGKEEDVGEFVSQAKSMDQWAMDEWIKERIEEDGWTESEVREYLDDREPIELT